MLLPKVWGGDALRRFGKPVREGDSIGESWEIADLAGGSESGAGAQPRRSVIDNGALRGQTLHDAIGRWGADLLGDAPVPDGFPLLVKYLDARQNLSVQVHPSPEYAAAHPGAHLKTECWYVVSAAPGALIYKGVRPGVTPSSFERHVAEGACQGDLLAVPAVAGDCHALPSGTVHALGAGVLVAEVQTPSDTTFRVYDWGRENRQLHVSEAMRCIEWGPAPPAARALPGAASSRLVANEFFTIDEHRLAPGKAATLTGSWACFVLMVLKGEGRLTTPGGELSLSTGATVLVPAAIAPGCAYAARSDTTLLRATVA